MRVLVTGGAGFVGSTAVRQAINAGHDVLTVDKLTYAGRREAIADVLPLPQHAFVQADIADSQVMEDTFRTFDPDLVLHLAAESHVDRSIEKPAPFISTNIVGAFVLLEVALRHWTHLVGPRRDRFRYIHVSTDEVFGALGD